MREAVLLAAVLAAGACAKSPTAIVARVSVDSTVPPLLLLRATLTADPDDGRRASQQFVSLARGDGGLPGPYLFPFDLPVRGPSSLVGPAILTVEGLDWDSYAVVARGQSQTEVVQGQTVRVAVVLTALDVGGGEDGGAGADSGGEGVDAGGDGAEASGPGGAGGGGEAAAGGAGGAGGSETGVGGIGGATTAAADGA